MGQLDPVDDLSLQRPRWAKDSVSQIPEDATDHQTARTRPGSVFDTNPEVSQGREGDDREPRKPERFGDRNAECGSRVELQFQLKKTPQEPDRMIRQILDCEVLREIVKEEDQEGDSCNPLPDG